MFLKQKNAKLGSAEVLDANTVVIKKKIYEGWIIFLVAINVAHSDSATISSTHPRKCRARAALLDRGMFALYTCADCYTYLFPVGKELIAIKGLLVSLNGTVHSHKQLLVPDVHNATNVNQICATLNSDECERWKQCCEAAQECCDTQLGTAHVNGDGRHCLRTWDGFGCWQDTAPNSHVYKPCPSFIQHAMPSIKATKYCTGNGTWFKDPVSELEWTNYTSCLEVQSMKTSIWIGVICNAVSLSLLIPAVLVFLAYRTLRCQHRIRLHINLFVAFIFTAVVYIMWDLLVVYDRLDSPATESLIHRHTPGCKLLYILTRYTRSADYAWMFFEGFYLHRLIVNAFEPPKSLVPFYVIGWAFPWLSVGVYAALRTIYGDDSCWITPVGPLEWIIYTPNLISLAMNFIFLFSILRILITQISVHPNEPSNYRRALKATFVLVPLFGLQMVCVIYRPPPNTDGSKIFDIISSIVTNSQGFFVALIFCFLNGEVMSHLKRTFTKSSGCCVSHMDYKPGVSTTQMMSLSRESRSHSINKSYIPMRAVNGNKS